MKYEFYMDVFFLLNFFVDTLLLFLLKRVLKCTATHLRLLVGGMSGAAMACLLTVLPGIPGWIKLFAGYGIVSIGMIKISFRQMNLPQACRATVYLYGLSFFFGGILEFLAVRIPFFRTYGVGILGISVTAILVYGSVSFFFERQCRKREKYLVPVTLVWKERKKTVQALLDTGNSLYEPIGGKPVSVLERSEAETLLGNDKPEIFRVIPFHSIGKSRGIMEGYELTELIVTGENETIRIEKPMVGLFDGKLSTGSGYQMILHPAITKNQEESV